jgi:WD40 repeat protein
VAQRERIYSTAVSPDGRLIVSGGRDGKLVASMPFDDRLVSEDADLGHYPSLGTVSSVSAGPKDLISVASSEGPFLLDVRRGLIERVASAPRECDVISHSHDGSFVVGGYSDVGLVAWHRTGKGFRESWRHAFDGQPAMTKIRLSGDSRFVAALISPQTTESKEVHLIDAATGKELHRMPVPGSFGLDFSKDGKMLAVSRDSVVLILSLPNFDVMQQLAEHQLSVPAVCFSPDDGWLATGAGDRKAILWNTRTWKASPWIAADGEIRCISFAPNGRTLLTASFDQVPALWDRETRRLLMHFPRVEGEVWPLRFTGSGDFIVGPHPERGLYVFDGRPIKPHDDKPINPLRSAATR